MFKAVANIMFKAVANFSLFTIPFSLISLLC